MSGAEEAPGVQAAGGSGGSGHLEEPPGVGGSGGPGAGEGTGGRWSAFGCGGCLGSIRPPQQREQHMVPCPANVLFPPGLSVQEGFLVWLASPRFLQRCCLTLWEGAFNFM